MKTLVDHLSTYAAYHRDPRNIAIHFIGIPLIVLGITALLSRPVLDISGLAITPAVLAVVTTSAFYLRLSRGLGAVMAGLLALAAWFGAWAAQQTTVMWLALGLGGFFVGWVFQFVGHYWEGRKPAFVDDIIGLVIGPLFVVVEALFGLGLQKDLKREVQARSGPVRRRGDDSHDAGLLRG